MGSEVKTEDKQGKPSRHRYDTDKVVTQNIRASNKPKCTSINLSLKRILFKMEYRVDLD